MISKVLNVLPDAYDSLVDSIHIQMNSEKGVSLAALKEQLIIKFQRIKKSSTRASKGETVLTTTKSTPKPTKVKRSKKVDKKSKSEDTKTEETMDRNDMVCGYCGKKRNKKKSVTIISVIWWTSQKVRRRNRLK